MINLEFPKRKPNRLKNYDYSQVGAYFITLCIQNRNEILGDFVGDGSSVPNGSSVPKLNLSKCGIITDEYVHLINEKYPDIKIDNYVIMPNHVHLILSIINGTGNPSPTVGSVIAWFKYQTTKQINAITGNNINKIWQRSYYDHIIKNEQD